MKTNIIYSLRNIRKNLTNSVITVIGLGVAIACCLLVYFFVSQESGYNTFHKNSSNIYRIHYDLHYGDGRVFKTVRLNPDLVDELNEKVPQINKSAEFRYAFTPECKIEDEYFLIDMAYCSRDFFNIFSFDFLAGSGEKIFADPNEIIITKEFADKILPNGNYSQLIGKTIDFPLHYSDKHFIVQGVLNDIPKNSSIYFQGIIPGSNERRFGGCNNWFGYASIYYMLKENADPKLVEKNVAKTVTDYYEGRIEEMKQSKMLADVPNAFNPHALPLKEIYFENSINSCNEKTGNKRAVLILIAVGTVIMIIAVSNYTMFAMANNFKKSNEFGTRKTLGATKRTVLTIFLTEGFIISLVAFLLGAILCHFLIPVFNQISDSDIYIQLINIPKVILVSLLAFIGLVLFTSIIPVLAFSNISPVRLLQKKNISRNRNVRLQFFVSFQYSLSIILIILSIFIIKQTNYLKTKSLGLNSKNIISVNLTNLQVSDRELLYEKLLSHPGIINMTRSSRNFMDGDWNDFIPNDAGEQILVDYIRVDHNYIPTMELNILDGDNFSELNERANDPSIIVNETFIKQFGIEENPIGKSYRFSGRDFRIIGVVNDFNFKDATRQVTPVFLSARTNMANNQDILIRFNPSSLSDLLKYLKKCNKEVAPGQEIDYIFWDEELGKRYAEEERWSKIISYASLIAIIISSLGLFGLTLLLINLRIKEIGIRKVNGAKISEVLTFVIKSFVIWLISAYAFAVPFAHIIAGKWLENFAYKIEVSPWVFLAGGGLTLLVAMLTICWQSWQVAKRNPVEALHYE